MRGRVTSKKKSDVAILQELMSETVQNRFLKPETKDENYVFNELRNFAV